MSDPGAPATRRPLRFKTLGLIAGMLLAVGLVALGYAFTIKPTFTAETRFLPPQQQQSAAAAMLRPVITSAPCLTVFRSYPSLNLTLFR